MSADGNLREPCGTRNLWTWVALAGTVGVALVLHVNAGFAFPRPWPDEAHFITPALTLARDARLAVPELNAASGIFWMPTGYYVVQVPLLVVGVDPLTAARWLSWIGVTLFALSVAYAATRAGANRILAAGAVVVWLCLPRVVAIANIARMEGVVLGLAGVCIVLLSRDRWFAAVAVAAAAPLVHPVGFILTVAVVGAGVVHRPGRLPTRLEWGLLAFVALCWIGEVVYFLAHADAAAAHLRFQFTRKAGRAITVRWWHALLLAASAAAGLVATWRWRRSAPLAAIWTALALAGGFVLVDLVGREMWYEPLGRETATLLLGLAVLVAATRLAVGASLRYTATVIVGLALVLAAVFGIRNTIVDGWYGMRPVASSSGEWRAFTDDAVEQLQRLDAAATEPALVVVDPLSGFAQEVFDRNWTNLRFVQPTPATPLDATSADYVLATPGAPFTTEALVGQWGAVPPALEVRSQQGTFTLQVFANPT